MHNQIASCAGLDTNECLIYHGENKSASLCSCSLMLHALRRSNKYQDYCLWFDLTGAQTHNLPNFEVNTTLTITPPMQSKQVYKL
jgi:hypothetical protein